MNDSPLGSFEDIGIAPELVDALTVEGVEVPTPLQAQAVPVIRRGNNVVLEAGPGSGTLYAYGLGVLDRMDPEGSPHAVLVLAPSEGAADGLARSLGRVAAARGISVAALSSAWAAPLEAGVLFATPERALGEVKASRLKLDAVESVVIDGASAMDDEALEQAGTLLELMPAEAQRIVVALPLSELVQSLCDRTVRKAVYLPPRAADAGADAPPVANRGDLLFRVSTERREEALLDLVAGIHAADDSARVLVYVQSDDAAADLGDYLTLHGFQAGAAGDDATVWLAGSPLEDTEGVSAIVSFDAPVSADALIARHGDGGDAVVICTSREIPHLRWTAKRAGFKLRPLPRTASTALKEDRRQIIRALEARLEEGRLSPWFGAMDGLLDRWDATEVAAAALSLAYERAGESAAPKGPLHRADVIPSGSTTTPGEVRTWSRLFVSVGEKDGLRPADLVGAVTGEAGVPASAVGKIEIRDTFSLLDVESQHAGAVIRGLNGTTLRGRSVRVDHDRGGRPPAGGERGGPRRSGGRDRDGKGGESGRGAGPRTAPRRRD